ncbi:hypothetical protein AgCh_020904 [Apium graveolens]
MVYWDTGLDNVMVNYFEELFKMTNSSWEEVLECVPRSVADAQNALLVKPVEAIKVKKALFHMHPDKSPGPDGMSPCFYQKYWGIVGVDIVNLVRSFFDTGHFVESLTDTNIVLVPKKKNPQYMTDIRSIYLCNVSYKIASKVLANRLKGVIDTVISESQSAFIPGRLISDNIMISYEIMHYMKRKNTGKKWWMALKLDMSKAYDRVEWNYLRAVPCKMGFKNSIIELFMKCVTTTRFKIAYGDREFGNTIPERGLRQGDPLSSYLFLACIEGLPAMVKSYENRGLIRGIKVARGAPMVTHMFFADDSYIYYRASKEEATQIMNLSANFETASGQKINVEKSSVFFNVRTDTKNEILDVLGFHEAGDNSHYLGLPNCIGRNKSAMLGYLKEKMRAGIQSWDGKLLNKSGKEILLKTVTQSMPNYAMSVFLLPLEMCKDMEKMMCKFWWKISSMKDKNIHWMSWERMSKSKLVGGLGFRCLHDFNVILLGKQGWRVGKGSSVSIVDDPWIPDIENPYVTTRNEAIKGKTVSNLMVMGERRWDVDLVRDIFNQRDTSLILATSVGEDNDGWYWRKEKLGQYSVKSAYILIQENKGHADTIGSSNFWKRMWNLKVPPKKGMEAREVVELARVVLSQWRDAQDKTFNRSWGLLEPHDGDEHWTFPEINKTKVNTDAAIFLASSCYAFAFIARNHQGDLVEARSSCKPGKVTPEFAEAVGIHEALSWIKSKHLIDVVVETNCLVAVQAIRGTTTLFSYFGKVIEECRVLMKELKGKRVILKFLSDLRMMQLTL